MATITITIDDKTKLTNVAEAAEAYLGRPVHVRFGNEVTVTGLEEIEAIRLRAFVRAEMVRAITVWTGPTNYVVKTSTVGGPLGRRGTYRNIAVLEVLPRWAAEIRDEDTWGPVGGEYETVDDAREAIERLREMGDHWRRAEYQIRSVARIAAHVPMISERARCVVRIVIYVGKVHVGKTLRSAGKRASTFAQLLTDALNEGQAEDDARAYAKHTLEAYCSMERKAIESA